jgi:hypothetical protein
MKTGALESADVWGDQDDVSAHSVYQNYISTALLGVVDNIDHNYKNEMLTKNF